MSVSEKLKKQTVVSWLWVDCGYFTPCHVCPHFRNCEVLKEKVKQP